MLTRLINYETSRKVRRVASRFGLNIRLSVNARPLDLTGETVIHPIAALYEAGIRPVILRVPLRQCIFFSFLAFPCNSNGPSPQVQTLTAYANEHCSGYHDSPLQWFYSHFTPNCAAELLGLNNPSYALFYDLPPTAALFPWFPQAPQEVSRLRQRYTVSEARQHSTGKDATQGGQFFGPVSTAQGQLEFRRLVSVYESIVNKGLMVDREGFNNVEAVCLANDGRTSSLRFFITSGQHRMAALAALDHDYVDLQIRPEGPGGFIRRNDAEYWPSVQKGYFTIEEAKNIFDRLFTGEQPWLFSQPK